MSESQKSPPSAAPVAPAPTPSAPQPAATPGSPASAVPAPAAVARKPEIGGPTGPEPTRYGDWEKAGRCVDF